MGRRKRKKAGTEHTAARHKREEKVVQVQEARGWYAIG